MKLLWDKIGSWNDRSGDDCRKRERDSAAIFGFDLMEDLPSRCRQHVSGLERLTGTYNYCTDGIFGG